MKEKSVMLVFTENGVSFWLVLCFIQGVSSKVIFTVLTCSLPCWLCFLILNDKFLKLLFLSKKKKKIRSYIIKHWHFTLWSFSHLYVLLYSYRGTEYHDTGLADTQLALLCSHITFKRAALLLNRRAAHNNVSHLLSQCVGKWKNVKAENIF